MLSTPQHKASLTHYSLKIYISNQYTLNEPVSRTASAEIRQNDGGLVRLQGGKQVLLKRRNAWAKPKGKTFAYVVLPDLQGKGPVRERSILANKHFWFLLVPQKELAPAAMSGEMLSLTTKYHLPDLHSSEMASYRRHDGIDQDHFKTSSQSHPLTENPMLNIYTTVNVLVM